MGGNAFSGTLQQSAFPRLPQPIYAVLKMRLSPILEGLYEFVGVPAEAPEKLDYGDLDFVVAGPKICAISECPVLVNVPHDQLQKAIGARYSNPMEGNRTSNFAIPIAPGEWKLFGHGEDETRLRQEAEGGEIFYQVDVNVCIDRAEWERIIFFHAYGDLGMILGLIARNAGLTLGTKGLKLPDAPYPPFDLAESFDGIIEFMGLSMETWKAGFKTKKEIFEWVGTSDFFVARHFKSKGEGIRKVKQDRKMYAEFVEWAEAVPKVTEDPRESREGYQARHIVKALVHFRKKEAFDALTQERSQRERLRLVFSGSRVRDWADIGEYWKGVKLIMDSIRGKVGGEDGLMRILDREGEEGIKKLVLQARDELGIKKKEDTEKLDVS